MMPSPDLLPTGAFCDFGPSQVLAPVALGRSLAIDGKRCDVRQALRESCPPQPGVYGVVDRQGRLVYVGCSRKLQSRLLTYFTGRKRRQKEHRIARRAARLHWEVCGHEFSALLRELELIQRFAPDFNVKGRRRTREPLFIYLTASTAPQFRCSLHVPSEASRQWGPFPNWKSLRVSVEQLNLALRLRDCPSHVRMTFATRRPRSARPLQPQCLRGETGTCLAPCAEGCTRRDYSASIQRGIALLDDGSAAVLDDLRVQMQTAASAGQYERAARVRDMLASVEDLRRTVHRTRTPPEPRAGVYVVTGGERPLWYLIGDSLLRGMLPAPTTADEARLTLDRIQRLSTSGDAPDSLARDSRRLLRAWFRRHPAELSAVQPLETVTAVCRSLLRPSRRQKSA